MEKSYARLFFIKLDDWTWWAWAVTTALLTAGLSGYGLAFIGAMAVPREPGPPSFPMPQGPHRTGTKPLLIRPMLVNATKVKSMCAAGT